MRVSLVVLFCAMLAGCGADEPPEKVPDDGKIRPKPSGERTTEALACDALTSGHSKLMLSLGCFGTSRTCPSMLRAQFAEACLEYDKGSVDGCLAHYADQTSCEDLSAALDICVVTAYEGSAPAGCP